MARRVIAWDWSSLVEQVRELCTIDPVTGCWVWTRATTKPGGYGVARIQTVKWRVNRAILYAVTGELHEASRHSCDNPPCCNPDHLSWGTRLDNAHDRVARERSAAGNDNGARLHLERIRRGSEQGSAKLTEGQVVQIRQRRASGATLRNLASEFGVCRTNISLIVRRETWQHVA